jgi:hypothetical protein
MSLCNATTGNGRSLRSGRRRRVRGGGGRGGWLWAAGSWLLAAGCCCSALAAGCLLAFLGISLSCQLAMALAPGPKPLPQPTTPCAASLPSATSSTPALPEEHPQSPHVKPARPLFRPLGPFKAASVPSAATHDYWFVEGPRLCLGRSLDVPGRVHTPEVLGRALTQLSSPPPRLTRRLFACYQYLAPWKCPQVSTNN